jgi:hypothetical protein
MRIVCTHLICTIYHLAYFIGYLNTCTFCFYVLKMQGHCFIIACHVHMAGCNIFLFVKTNRSKGTYMQNKALSHINTACITEVVGTAVRNGIIGTREPTWCLQYMPQGLEAKQPDLLQMKSYLTSVTKSAADML